MIFSRQLSGRCPSLALVHVGAAVGIQPGNHGIQNGNGSEPIFICINGAGAAVGVVLTLIIIAVYIIMNKVLKDTDLEY